MEKEGHTYGKGVNQAGQRGFPEGSVLHKGVCTGGYAQRGGPLCESTLSVSALSSLPKCC